MDKRIHPHAERYIAARAQGLTYKQIAEVYGVSPQVVQQCCARKKEYAFRPFTTEQVVYTNLRQWMNENKVSIAELTRRAGLVSYATTRSRYSAYLTGKSDPPKKTIDKLLEITNMTYEELFRRETE